MWWCFLCFFFVFSLVFQFYVLEYGIHFCRRDFWIVLFVPFHIFILYACVSHISTCDSATVVTLVRAICICFYDLLCGYSLWFEQCHQAFPGNLHPSGFPSGHWYWFATALMFVQKTWRRFEGSTHRDSPYVCERNLCHTLCLKHLGGGLAKLSGAWPAKGTFHADTLLNNRHFWRCRYIYSASLLVFQIEPHFVLQNEPPTYDMHHLHPIFFRCK